MKRFSIFFAALMVAVSMMANTVYFVNKSAWSAPHCYAWTGGSNNGAWPGVAMTKESYQLAGADVYSYTTTESYDNCIFNNGGQPQTADLTWSEGMYFDGSSWKTRAQLEGNQDQGGGQQQGGGPTGEGNPRYYYKGYIDGRDVEPDDAELSNRFYGGTAELTVSTDAYLFVLYQVDGVAGQQYMTASYVDGATHATLLTTGGEKMHLGAGSYTLYLYDNGDGTLELSTQPLPGKTLCDPDGENTAVEHPVLTPATVKFVEEGRLVIMRDGVRYGMDGARL